MDDDLDDDVWTTIIADDLEGDGQFRGIGWVAAFLVGVVTVIVLLFALFR